MQSQPGRLLPFIGWFRDRYFYRDVWNAEHEARKMAERLRELELDSREAQPLPGQQPSGPGSD